MASAAIYARVSSARQKKDQTIASQTAALRTHEARRAAAVLTPHLQPRPDDRRPGRRSSDPEQEARKPSAGAR